MMYSSSSKDVGDMTSYATVGVRQKTVAVINYYAVSTSIEVAWFFCTQWKEWDES